MNHAFRERKGEENNADHSMAVSRFETTKSRLETTKLIFEDSYSISYSSSFNSSTRDEELTMNGEVMGDS